MDFHEPRVEAEDAVKAGKGVALEPLFVYGVKPEVKGDIFFATDNVNLLYPSGCGMGLYHTKAKKQTLIPLASVGRHLTAICANKTRQLVAFAERGDRPAVVVFDLETRRRRKMLRCAEFESQEVVSLAFSHDSKYLLAQGGEPDFSLVYFFWEKSKVVTVLKNLSTSKSPITQVSFHPKNHTIICIVGNGFFRMCKLTEGVLKPFGFQKGEHHLMTYHDWLTPNHVAIGTKNGNVLLMENAELRTTVDVSKMVQDYGAESSGHLQMSVPVRDRSSFSVMSFGGVSSGASSVISEEKVVHDIKATKDGFVASVGSGFVVVCHCRPQGLKNVRPGEDIEFDMVGLLRLPRGSTNTSYRGNVRNLGTRVISMALSSNESLLVALTDTLQLVVAALKEGTGSSTSSAATEVGAPHPSVTGPKVRVKEFSVLCHPFHFGAITGMDSCFRKPLVVTCGADKSIRVWNYETMEVELSKEFDESLSCVALHPTGLQVLAGFSDKLRLMNLLIDDIRVCREFHVKNAPVCSFSRGGHLMAAVSGKNIAVFSSITFKEMANLRGHNGTIRSMQWSSDDRVLVSCGADGAVYEWDMANHGRRKNEIITKSSTHHDVALVDDPPQDEVVAFTVCSDKTIKEIHNSILVREVDLHSVTLTSMAVAADFKLLFAGSTSGKIHAFQFPLTLPGVWSEFNMHGDQVTHMRLSPDGKRLVTAGKDGSLCIWHVKAAEGFQSLSGEATKFEYANDILITKTELEEKNKMMLSLEQQVDETRTESEYQLRLKDNQFAEEAQIRQKQFNNQLADLRQAIHKAQNTIENNKKQHENTVRVLKEENENATIRKTDYYKEKLIVEYQRFEELKEETTATKSRFEKRLLELEDSKARSLHEKDLQSARTLEAKEAEIAAREKEIEMRVKAVEEMLKQTEEDADKEILELKTKYERILRQEREANVRLRGEAGVMKKRLQSTIKDGEEFKTSIQKVTGENQRLQQTIKALERDISEMKKEIKSRDDTIAEREKTITDIKRTCMELEKNRVVLQHKIAELRRQMEPKDAMIGEMHLQIQDMEDGLTRVSKSQGELQQQISDYKSKLMANMAEMSAMKKMSRKQAVIISRMQTDLGDLCKLQDGKTLKEAVAKLSKKWIKDGGESEAGSVLASQDDENTVALKEVVKQKAFLERTVASLRSQLSNQEQNHKRAYSKKLQQNMLLVKEVEKLKADLDGRHGRDRPN